jgi:hypothetical protein
MVSASNATAATGVSKPRDDLISLVSRCVGFASENAALQRDEGLTGCVVQLSAPAL